MSGHSLDTSRHGDSSTSLDSPFQCLITLSTDKTSALQGHRGWRHHLKSGMPLGVLIPAPAITTTRRHSFFWSSLATSFKVSCCLSLSPPQLSQKALAAVLREKGLEPWILLGTGGSTALRELTAISGQGEKITQKFHRKLFSGKDCAWASLGESLAVSLTQTLEQTRPSAIPYVDLKLPNHQYSCERGFLDRDGHKAGPTGNHHSQC